MDAMRSLTSGEGCSADGTSATSNPLSNLVNQGLGMDGQGQAKQGNPAMNRYGYQSGAGAGASGYAGAQMGDSGLHQGMAQGMGLSHHPGVGGPRGMARGPAMPRGAPQMSGDAFVREFQAQQAQQAQQAHAAHAQQHQAMHAHQQAHAQQHQQRMAGPMMGPRGPMARGHAPSVGMGEDWVRGFEQMRVSGQHHPPGSMDAAFAQSFRGPPRAQAWAQEMSQLPPGATGQMEQGMNGKFHDGTDGNDWAAEAVKQMKEEEANFEERFRQEGDENAPDVEATRRATAEMANIMSQNPKFRNSEFLDFMKQVSSGSVIFQDNEVVQNPNAPAASTAQKSMQQGVEGFAEEQGAFEATAASAGPQQSMSEAWGDAKESMEDLFAKAWQDSLQGKEVDMDQIFQQALEREKESGQSLANAWAETEFMNPMQASWDEAKADPGSAPYQMASENPYTEHESPYEQGLRLFKEGNTSDAVLAFEAAVTQDSANADAWRMLGVSHQENDEDRRAIACLERAVDEDPYHLDALLGLGVSYVNELDEPRALRNLKTWIQNNPSFQGLEVKADPYSDGSMMDDVMQLMLQAADWAPQDPGVQEVLGVLYNVSRDYDSAAGAFRKAISRNPDDYSLWNKMGATLANGSKSEEALPAYHRALELKPRYVRGWLNLGISHSNLGQYSEAARCYLKALDLNPSANHIWSYLRIAFTIMERPDLIELANAKDLDAFRSEFKF